jgi:hypothetical protein
MNLMLSGSQVRKTIVMQQVDQGRAVGGLKAHQCLLTKISLPIADVGLR